MSETIATVSGAAGRYATALFELAEETGQFDAVAGDVSLLRDALGASDELADALHNPSISRAQMGRVADALATKLGVSDLSRKFLGLMAAKRRLAALPAALAGFEALAAEKRGEAAVSVVAATPLTDEQQASLTDALATAVGRKIHMQVDVDPELIGGLIVKIGSKMIDASVRSKLSTLQHAMKEAG